MQKKTWNHLFNLGIGGNRGETQLQAQGLTHGPRWPRKLFGKDAESLGFANKVGDSGSELASRRDCPEADSGSS